MNSVSGRFADILVVLLQYFGNVSVRGLGTFYLETYSASFDQTRSFIHPPFEKVLFKSSYDPAYEITVLVKKLSLFSALSAHDIQNLTEDLIHNLNQTGKAEISGIGSLLQSAASIEFVPSQENFHGQYYGLASVGVKAVPLNHPRNAGVTIQTTETGTLVYRKSQQSQSNRYLILPLLAGLVTLAIILGRYISCNKSSSNLPHVATETVIIPQTSPDTAVSTEKEEAEDVSVIPADTAGVAQLPDFDGECVIIVGSFAKESNAKRMYNKVKRAGYNPYYQNTNGRVRVGMSFECKEEDLTDSMKSMRRKFAKDAWYLKPEVRIE
ncbi:MAG: SPOR domain-containing protein [Saprospiraceae bacterium]|nr:SPOR domain-containing protein [Saprospiraceae bacterium]